MSREVPATKAAPPAQARAGLRAAAGRMAEYLASLAVLAAITFFALRALPGDPLSILYGEASVQGLTPENRAILASRHGLDASLPEQFLHYAGMLCRGDLGQSARHARPVAQVIGQALPWTLLLVTSATAMALAAGLFLGIEAGMRRGRTADVIILAAVTALDSLPLFVKAILALFALCLGLTLFPAFGAATPFTQDRGWALAADVAWHAAVPAGVLALHEITKLTFVIRAMVVTVRGRPFLTVARAKGVGAVGLRSRHVAPNVMAQVTARTAAMFTELFAGSIFVETVFSYPGLGRLLYEGIFGRDYPLVQGLVLVLGAGVLTVNMAADLVIGRLTEREARG